ncbi:synaptic vesicle glycoprotein 2C [Scaptodrosophila lebanonensis]|uniref:Synaptic vesicle glycoprotein 2C n=1 Tax=Drosophila lebanonensis TaxID=7225 RepID=A0A6J2TLQ4_DROLE|nr:synaptic vesicle glycoprotein 2C [Scaptodrosophila lebanonensis]
MIENNNQSSDSKTKETDAVDSSAPVDFERAIEAAGFGLFNVILLLVSIPAAFASTFESSTMSFILPVAECDLHLTLTDKGVLNAVAYGGMTVSAIAWGYLADTKGRRKVLMYGFLVDAFCVFGSAISQNFAMLVIFKFLGGLVINGPAAVLYTYLTELHGAKHRSQVLLVLGMVMSAAQLALPLLAWGIFPREWDFEIFGFLNIHSWHVFLFVCGVPSLISGLILSILPESPRFLMSQGRNAEALQALQKIYVYNTRLPKETYPVKELVEEVPSRDANKDEVIYTIEAKAGHKKPHSRTFTESLRSGMKQVKPMFQKPLLGLSLHCYTMQFCILLSMNTIRLWLPQLFASMAEYEAFHANDGEKVSADICTILEYSINRTAETATDYESVCLEPKPISMDMYTNNIIISAVGFVSYFFAGGLMRALGGKRLLVYGLFISGILGMILYWSVNSLMTLIVSAAFITVSGIATVSLLGAVVALFPTSLRSLVVAIAMMCGRFGALSGNLLFPIFIQIGCIPPFLMVALVMLFAAMLAIFVPNPNKTEFS